MLVALSCALTILGLQPTIANRQQTASTACTNVVCHAKAGCRALIGAADYDVPALSEYSDRMARISFLSADPVRTRTFAAAFAAKAREKNVGRTKTQEPQARHPFVGNEDWPVPIPIVEKNGKWYFDSKAGRKEILVRRIGGNELDAITICRGFVEAQKEYAEQIHDDSGVNQYAQRIISTPGKQDGLAWQNPDGSWGGPVGER